MSYLRCERLRYDLPFKWFLDLNISDPGFDASSFSKNRERLLEHDVARHFFSAVVAEARRLRLLSAEPFTVDGSLLEAWAPLKSYRPRDEEDGPRGGGRNPRRGLSGQSGAVERRTSHAPTRKPSSSG